MDRNAPSFFGHVWGELGAVKDDDPGFWEVDDAGRIKDRGDSLQVSGRDVATGDMVDGEQGVGFSAAKRSLELDDGVTALPGDPLYHGIEEEAHSFGDVGALEEEHGVAILGTCCAGMDAGEVSRELRLLEGAFQDVFVRNSDLPPGS